MEIHFTMFGDEETDWLDRKIGEFIDSVKSHFNYENELLPSTAIQTALAIWWGRRLLGLKKDVIQFFFTPIHRSSLIN